VPSGADPAHAVQKILLDIKQPGCDVRACLPSSAHCDIGRIS